MAIDTCGPHCSLASKIIPKTLIVDFVVKISPFNDISIGTRSHLENRQISVLLSLTLRPEALHKAVMTERETSKSTFAMLKPKGGCSTGS